MKIFRRNLVLASSALALVMLFGCSSTEETSDSGSGGGENTDQECIDACAAIPGQSEDECLLVCD
jgi:hypothetical protein